MELIAFHKEATGFEYATWLGNSNCKGITKEQLYLGISVVLRQIGNGSQNHQKDATKEVKCKSKEKLFSICTREVNCWKFGMKFYKFTSHSTAVKEQVNSKKIRDAPQKEIETLEQESQKGLGEEAIVK